MQFSITAYRAGEPVAALILEADSAEAAIRAIESRGYAVLAVRPVRWLSWRRSAKGAFDLKLFSQDLRLLLEAGLSLVEGLGAMARKGDRSQPLVEELIRHLREGKAFSQALAAYPAVFPPIYCALVGASEQTGDLAGALGRFIDYRARIDAVRERLVTAAIYPVVLVVVGGAVILFLMVYVVPRFGRIYADMGGELPFMSRLLLQVGTSIGDYGGVLLAGLLLLVGGAAGLAHRRKLAWRDVLLNRLTALLRWPALAPLHARWRSFLLARFYRTVGLLLQGGLALASALAMGRPLLDAALQAGLDRTLVALRGGVAVSEAMARGELVPAVADALLRTGERTGDLADKMLRIADFLDQDMARWADWASRLFEPLLTLLIGLFIAFIVVLLYMPIFELAGSLQ